MIRSLKSEPVHISSFFVHIYGFCVLVENRDALKTFYSQEIIIFNKNK